MKYVWAPWRIAYIRQPKINDEDCILCSKPKEADDAGNYIVYRGKFNFVMLNSFPYNPGHLLVAPNRHIATPEELSEAEIIEHYGLVNRSISVLREVYNPAGFNTGMNLGRVAGAGIDKHIHSHIVPRWQGDTNFMPVLADARVLPEALADTYLKLKEAFDKRR